MSKKPAEPMTTRRALLLANFALMHLATPGPHCELRDAAAKLKTIRAAPQKAEKNR